MPTVEVFDVGFMSPSAAMLMVLLEVGGGVMSPPSHPTTAAPKARTTPTRHASPLPPGGSPTVEDAPPAPRLGNPPAAGPQREGVRRLPAMPFARSKACGPTA